MIEQPKFVRNSNINGDEYSHRAYGQIVFARTTGVNRYLYGSDFNHSNTICISISRSSLSRNHGIDHSFSREELIEVELSESQWASMVSSLNMGSGTLCTIRHVDGQYMPTLPPPEEKQEIFKKSLSDTLETSLRYAKELRAMLEGSGMSKKKIDEMLSKLNQVEMNIDSNVDYVGKVFGEHMERTVSKAKVEVEAYVTGTINRAGLAALRGSDTVISLDK